jgi:hypothetical protein
VRRHGGGLLEGSGGQDAEGDRPSGGYFASGACLQMETAVPLEAEIHWESPQQAFTGRVRYCVYREIGYFVGVEFEPESRWSKETYSRNTCWTCSS